MQEMHERQRGPPAMGSEAGGGRMKREGKLQPNCDDAPETSMSTERPQSIDQYRVITKKQLLKIVPYTAQHILRLEGAGKFPKRLQLGANRVGWLQTEIEAWLKARIAERDAKACASSPPELVGGTRS